MYELFASSIYCFVIELSVEICHLFNMISKNCFCLQIIKYQLFPACTLSLILQRVQISIVYCVEISINALLNFMFINLLLLSRQLHQLL